MDEFNQNFSSNNDGRNSEFSPNVVIVQESASELRRLARMALSGLWQKAVIGVLIYQLLMAFLPSIISAIVPGFTQTYTLDDYMGSGVPITVTYTPFNNFYQTLLSGPIVIGFTIYLLNIVRRREINNKLIFKGFENFFKSFLLQFLTGLLCLLWGLPGILIAIVGASLDISFLAFIGMLMMVILIVIALFKYAMAKYYLADNPGAGVMQCINMSVNSMKGNKMNLFVLRLTFIGWMFLALLITGVIAMPFGTGTGVLNIIINFISEIPLFFVLLYLNISETFFYEILSGHLVKQ